ncbi:RNA polymerase-associated protein rtf1 [Cyclospora cayetanensis]|uniref:RNA polymerase-associated protein rtf1 n=1 Tax=Cyclospora cayetanensis TaxID=88456 RepID=A0A1D3DA28_9EIME|nr:RNA polymerase-associated protein rtf1 [Cyclospora cayetanensis]
MKRARRRGEGPLSEGPFLSTREFDAELLYRDDNDKKALESMNEFQREAELARRYEEVARERQRAELLRSSKDRKDGRLEALSDIRARRARMKQLQSKASDTSCMFAFRVVDPRMGSRLQLTLAFEGWWIAANASEEGEIQSREGSEMEFSSEAEGPPSDAEAPQTPKKPPEEIPEPKSVSKKRPAARPDEGDASLFAEDRLDFEERTRKSLSLRMLGRLSLALLNRVRVSVSRLNHILEHPQAESYLKGCVVKVSPPGGVPALRGAPPPDAIVCQIVGIRTCSEYSVKVDGSIRRCIYSLVLRPTPKASAKYDREFTLAELIDAPATQKEFDNWLKKLQQFDTVDDLAKKMKNKAMQLEKFTFTDADVQQILQSKEKASASPLQTRGALIKQATALRHQVNSVMASLSSTSTASSDRKELRECLAVLLQRKAAAEAQLAKCRFQPLADTINTQRRLAQTIGDTPRRGGLLTAHRRHDDSTPPSHSGAASPAVHGMCIATGLQSIMGQTHEQQQRLASTYVQIMDTGASLAARIKAAPPPPGAYYAPLMLSTPAKIELPAQCLSISLEEYKRQVAQLASMQLGG